MEFSSSLLPDILSDLESCLLQGGAVELRQSRSVSLSLEEEMLEVVLKTPSTSSSASYRVGKRDLRTISRRVAEIRAGRESSLDDVASSDLTTSPPSHFPPSPSSSPSPPPAVVSAAPTFSSCSAGGRGRGQVGSQSRYASFHSLRTGSSSWTIAGYVVEKGRLIPMGEEGRAALMVVIGDASSRPGRELVRLNFFDENARHFSEVLEEGRTFSFSGGRVRSPPSLTSGFIEIVFERGSTPRVHEIEN